MRPFPTTADNATIELPQYRSHKRVGAIKIDSVRKMTSEDPVSLPPGSLLLSFDKPAGGVTGLWFTPEQLDRKPLPQPGMYLVHYDNGYFSFSPAKAFEEGYTLVEPRD